MTEGVKVVKVSPAGTVPTAGHPAAADYQSGALAGLTAGGGGSGNSTPEAAMTAAPAMAKAATRASAPPPWAD